MIGEKQALSQQFRKHFETKLHQLQKTCGWNHIQFEQKKQQTCLANVMFSIPSTVTAVDLSVSKIKKPYLQTLCVPVSHANHA